jgi:outer membrane protein insertion porin family
VLSEKSLKLIRVTFGITPSRLFIKLFISIILLSIFSVPSNAAESYSGIVSEIIVSGNRLISSEEIIEKLQTKVGSSMNKDIVIGDLRNVYSMGYFLADSVQAKPYRKSDDSILLEINVIENPPITDLIIYGNNAVKDVEAYDFFIDMIAKPENARLISERIRLLEQYYYSLGYVVSRVSDIDLDESGLLRIYINEGIIDKIVYSGNNKTKDGYINHLINNVKVNEPYNEAKFLKDYRRLQGNFATVSRSVKPSVDSDGYTLDIQFSEKDKNTTIGLGGGVNTSAGLFGNATYARGNLRGQGETLNFNALLGSGFGADQTLGGNRNLVRNDNITQISANYNIPYYRNSDYNLSTGASYLKGPNFNVDLTTQTLTTLQARTSRAFDGGHRFSLAANANHIDIKDRDRERYINEVSRNIMERDGLTNSDIIKKKGSDFLGGARGIARAEARAYREEHIVDGFYFGLAPGYVYSNLDDPLRPRDGWRSSLDLNPVLGLGGINSFTRFDASTTKFFPVGNQSSFLFNLRGGSELIGDIPQFSKFRLGNNTGVRGYRQFSDLGIGSKVLISTAEFRTPIYHIVPPLQKYRLIKENVQFAVFADAGIIGGDKRLNDVSLRLSQAAALGFGLRVNVPLLGALRFDMGFPLIQVLTKDSRLFRFNFGPANMF